MSQNRRFIRVEDLGFTSDMRKNARWSSMIGFVLMTVEGTVSVDGGKER